MSEKSPAFQVYAADFLADRNVIVMTAQEVGAYWLLILVCWREGHLINDVEELAAIARMNPDDFAKSWEKKIRRCFQQSEDGKIIHPRLDEERIKQAEWREKSAEGGRKSGEVRKAKSEAKKGEELEMPSEADKPPETVKGGSRVVQPKPNQTRTLQSSVFGLQDNPPTQPTGARAESDESGAEEAIDEAYLDELQANPAYEKINVRIVFGKLSAHCKAKKRQVTRDRLVTWLNTEWERKPQEVKQNGISTGNGTARETASTRNGKRFIRNADLLAGRK